MKTARCLSGWATALLALLPAFAFANVANVTLDFNPTKACNAGPCSNGGASGTPSTISSSYGGQTAKSSVSYISDLKSGGTGPMYFWDTGIGVNNFAIGGDPSGGGAGLIYFTVLPDATSVTLKSFDIGSWQASYVPEVHGIQPRQAYSESTVWWAVYRVTDFSPGHEIARSWTQAGDAGSPIGVGTLNQVELNGGLGFSDSVGLVLKWGNSAEVTTYVGVDNVKYSVTSAVPEADTFGLIASGLAVMAWTGRRRKPVERKAKSKAKTGLKLLA